jgi:ribosome biogenesis protein Nip4
MRQINDFTSKFNASVSLDRDLIVKKDGRYFLLDRKLKSLIRKHFLYAGTYLGKEENDTFFPSFNLLAMIAQTDANRIVVDKKSEWLFICGRDVFKRGITRTSGPGRKGDYTLILNEHGNCLGFGRILRYLDTQDQSKIAVKNIVDIGDFLRRER